MKMKVVLGINLALAANLVLKTISVKNAIRFVPPPPAATASVPRRGEAGVRCGAADAVGFVG